ncbi:unnamed protein product, partial [marine sediment metagenome]
RHVRVGKRGPKSQLFPKGKPQAIAVTKIRTMKREAHADWEKAGRDLGQRITRLGKWMRKKHYDELPQIINVLKGDLNPIGLRVLPKSEYRKLPPELKRIYDEVGPSFLPLHYACKHFPPTIEEYIAVAQEFYEMRKKNKTKAYWVFGKRILKNMRGRAISHSEIK